MATRLTRLSLAAAVWASLLASGCMMEPLHGDSIEDRHEETFDFWGATDFAFETISIQARDDTGVWNTIATTTSSKLPETMWGVTAYPWERLDVRVPVRGHYWVDTAEPGFNHECELRAVGSMSGPLATFDASMRGSFTTDPDYSLRDLWNDYGHGDSVTVYSEN